MKIFSIKFKTIERINNIMGRDLHPTILTYFEKAINGHNKVSSCRRVDDPNTDDDYFYLVERKNMSDVWIHLSDEYCYTQTNYYQKPTIISNGWFIYIARPEASYGDSIVDVAREDQISIGKLSALMELLHKKEHWKFEPSERKKND